MIKILVCPQCQQELPDDFGVIRCPRCQTELYIDMDSKVSLLGEDLEPSGIIDSPLSDDRLSENTLSENHLDKGLSNLQDQDLGQCLVQGLDQEGDQGGDPIQWSSQAQSDQDSQQELIHDQSAEQSFDQALEQLDKSGSQELNLDSNLNSQNIFKQNELTDVSQSTHNQSFEGSSFLGEENSIEGWPFVYQVTISEINLSEDILLLQKTLKTCGFDNVEDIILEINGGRLILKNLYLAQAILVYQMILVTPLEVEIDYEA